jgi:hypothetical protein
MLGACAAIVLVTGSCIEDPLSDLDGNPAAVVSSHGLLVLAPGEEEIITVRAVDGRSTPLGARVTVTPCDADVIVTEDPTYAPVPRTSQRFVVTAVTSGASCVQMSAGGAVDSVTIGVLPVAFAGTPSATTLQTGDILTIASTPELEFDTATANIDFGNGTHGMIVNRTATSLSVIVPIPAGPAAPLTIEGVSVTYVPGLVVNLATSGAFTITNPHEPNDAPDPATTVTPPADTIYDGFPPGTADKFYTFTLAASTTFTVHLEWEGDADLDILFCNAGCSAFVGNFAGATGANPERSTVTLAAGTYNLYINNFTPAESAPLYRVRIVP